MPGARAPSPPLCIFSDFRAWHICPLCDTLKPWPREEGLRVPMRPFASVSGVPGAPLAHRILGSPVDRAGHFARFTVLTNDHILSSK